MGGGTTIWVLHTATIYLFHLLWPSSGGSTEEEQGSLRLDTLAPTKEDRKATGYWSMTETSIINMGRLRNLHDGGSSHMW